MCGYLAFLCPPACADKDRPPPLLLLTECDPANQGGRQAIHLRHRGVLTGVSKLLSVEKCGQNSFGCGTLGDLNVCCTDMSRLLIFKLLVQLNACLEGMISMTSHSEYKRYIPGGAVSEFCTLPSRQDT